MSFRLTIDGPAWDRTLHAVAARNPGLVPVIKGNGYGFGSALLADRARELGVPVVAVGVAAEIDAVRAYYAGDVLVMGPLQRSEVAATAVSLGVRRVRGPGGIADPRRQMKRRRPRSDARTLVKRKRSSGGVCPPECAI